MKIVLVMLDEDKRAKGTGFMKRVKDRWDMKYPEHESASWQKLRHNSFQEGPGNKELDPSATKGRGPGSGSCDRE